MPPSADAPDIVILPPVLVGGTLIAGIILHYWILPVSLFPVIPARAVGLIVFLLSGVLAWSAEKTMKRAGTNIFPTRPALALVTDGPFRVTRNPLYVASLGVYLGVALWVDGPIPLFLLLPVFAVLHWGVVLREEQYLDRKFGDAYRQYRSQVRRWL